MSSDGLNAAQEREALVNDLRRLRDWLRQRLPMESRDLRGLDWAIRELGEPLPTAQEVEGILREATHVGGAIVREEDGVQQLRFQLNRSSFGGMAVKRFMTGAEIKYAPTPPIPADHDLYLIYPGRDDVLVLDEDVVDVPSFGGGLRMFTQPRFINAG